MGTPGAFRDTVRWQEGTKSEATVNHSVRSMAELHLSTYILDRVIPLD